MGMLEPGTTRLQKRTIIVTFFVHLLSLERPHCYFLSNASPHLPQLLAVLIIVATTL